MCACYLCRRPAAFVPPSLISSGSMKCSFLQPSRLMIARRGAATPRSIHHRGISQGLFMSSLTDKETAYILQPSPYQKYRRFAANMSDEALTAQVETSKRKSTAKTKEPMAPELNFPTHEELMSALNEIRGDPLEEFGGRIVTYRGNPQARLMIIGEAPGEQEDLQGKPFVGRAGQLLDKIFEYGGFEMGRQTYITNVAKRRPPGNRNPTMDEVAFFMPYLREEIRLVNPAILILAGNVPGRALLGPELKITKARGGWFGGRDGPHIMPILHPSYLLRNQIAKYDMVTDIEAIRAKYLDVVPEDPLKPLDWRKKESESHERQS